MKISNCSKLKNAFIIQIVQLFKFPNYLIKYSLNGQFIVSSYLERVNKTPIELTSTKCGLSSNITILLSWSRKVGNRSHEQDQRGSFRLRIRASIFRPVDLGKSYVPFSTTSSHLLPRNRVYLVFLTTSRLFFFPPFFSPLSPFIYWLSRLTSSFTPSAFDVTKKFVRKLFHHHYVN